MTEITDALKQARRIWQSIFPHGLQIPRVHGPNTNLAFPADLCPDHWENVAIFGQCWKHNPDGSLKRLFAKEL